jgi:uncharacterized protein YqgC (DUF456 family)
MDWVYYLLLVGVSVVGLALAVIGLPGIWLIVAAAGVYAYLTDGYHIAWWGLLTLILLGVLAEILETALGGVVAGKAGGSKRGMLGAVVGGILGAILGTPLIPIPVLGTLIGACLGAFGGTFAVEVWWVKRTTQDSLKIGAGAAAGRLAGTLTKLLFGGAMLVVVALWALPLTARGPAAAPPAAPASMPASAPATLPADEPAQAESPGTDNTPSATQPATTRPG